jgi:hypothetical protein
MADRRFSLNIRLENVAMRSRGELNAALHSLGDRLLGGETEGVVKDVNGNTVGRWEITDREPFEIRICREHARQCHRSSLGDHNWVCPGDGPGDEHVPITVTTIEAVPYEVESRGVFG